MDNIKDRYYTIPRLHLSAIGIWPTQRSWLNSFYRVLFSCVVMGGIVTQLTAYATHDLNLDIFLKSVPYVVFLTIFLVKYQTFYIKMDDIGHLLESCRRNWKSLNDDDEREIIKKYADEGRFVNIIFTSLIYPATCVGMLNLFGFIPSNHVSSVNGSHTNKHPFLTEYFFDHEKYYYIVILHFDAVCYVGGATLVGTETITILFAHHAAGLFHLVCYRVKCAFDHSLLDTPVCEDYKRIHEKLIKAIDMHKQALEYSKCMGSTFSTSYFILLTLGVASLTLNLVRLSHVQFVMNEIEEVFSAVFLVIAHFTYIFFANYMAQTIIDSSSCMLSETYDNMWYMAPVSEQKLLLFIMQNSTKNYTYLVGGIFTPSFEGFTTLTRMSMSYFMVITST